jgi:hypothetical protein
MARKVFSLLFLLGLFLFVTNCSDNDDNQPDVPANSEVKTRGGIGHDFNYKIYYQESTQANARRGLIILAVGDGGNKDDATLNEQCNALAKKGFVAITTTYRPSPGTYINWMASFKENIEQVIQQETEAFNIPRNKVVIGGLSRGGNLTLGSVLPGQMGDIPPIAGIKGVILECAGGDEWKGSAILFPVLFMSNATDNAVGTNAEGFKAGLQNNGNTDVKAKSKTLVIPGEGHCSGSAQYKDFIINNIDSWF